MSNVVVRECQTGCLTFLLIALKKKEFAMLHIENGIMTCTFFHFLILTKKKEEKNEFVSH